MEDDKNAEFVVVGTLNELRSASEQVQIDIMQLRNQVAAMKAKTNQLENMVEQVESSWNIVSSAVLMVAPLMLAYVLDYKSRELYMSDLTSLAPIITALVCVSVCIGVPVFAAALLEHNIMLDIQEAKAGASSKREKRDKREQTDICPFWATCLDLVPFVSMAIGIISLGGLHVEDSDGDETVKAQTDTEDEPVAAGGKKKEEEEEEMKKEGEEGAASEKEKEKEDGEGEGESVKVKEE